MFSWLGAIGSIIFVDLILSGDNAIVIGATAATLPKSQRLVAIAIGGSFALILRILFAVLATSLLQLPFLGIVGAVLVIIIAVRLLLERHAAQKQTLIVQPSTDCPPVEAPTIISSIQSHFASRSFLSSILTILIADLTMSLDNILAVGALASGNLLFLIVGLLLSVVFLLASSALLANFIAHLPWLLDLACLILAWTASNIALNDMSTSGLIKRFPLLRFLIPFCAFLVVLLADLVLFLSSRRQRVMQE